MAKYGNEIIKQGATILTHCNTGALATVAYGTALGVVREAHYTGKNIFVYADETRPRLQGGRLTAWELVQENIPAKLIADNVAATLIRDGKIDVILVGADRVATNGDSANKIGTFMLSVVAKAYNVPFYIVAPTTTIDFEIETGKEIHIEERSSEEVTHIEGVRIAPEGIDVFNPAFDVTPWENINKELEVECKLADAVVSRWTASTAEAMYHHLLYNINQKELATQLEITQPGVHKRLVVYGNINSIRTFLNRYHDLMINAK